MKKIISLVLVLFITVLCLAGCGKKDRMLFADTDFSKIVELSEYKNIPVDTQSETLNIMYDDTILEDITKNDFRGESVTEGVIAKGDIANIDYIGKKDGVAFEGGTAQGYDLEIGSGSFIPGFEDGLIGVNIGDTVDLDLTFPENYQSADLAGAKVVFTVKVNSAKQAKSPKNYCHELGFNSLKEYEEDVKKRTINQYLSNTLITNSKIKEYPQKELDLFYNSYISSFETNVKNSYGIDFKTYLEYTKQTEEDFKKSAMEQSIKPTVEQFIINYAILDAEGMKITEKEIEKEINDTVKEIGDSQITAEYLKKHYGNFFFEANAVCDKVAELIYSNAKIY